MKLFTSTLDEILNRFNSDKGSAYVPDGHAYSFVYERLFEPFRNDSFTLVEIGLCRGGGPEDGDVQEGVARQPETIPSVDAWLEYFPNARIVGFDISDFSKVSRNRFTFVRGDSGLEEDLQGLADAAKRPRLIIDDGSHASYHQLLAFHILFPALEPGGIYVIEDVHWQPSIYETNLPNTPKVLELFQDFQRTGSFTPGKGRRLQLAEWLDLVHKRPAIPVEGWERVAREINYVLTITRTQNDKAIIIYKKESAA